MQIRTVEPCEWAVYRDVRLRALAESPEAFGSTLESERDLTSAEWRARLARADRVTYIAYTNLNHPMGLVAGAPYDDQAGLFSMWVDPNHRSQGVGGALVDAIVAWARRSKYQMILLAACRS